MAREPQQLGPAAATAGLLPGQAAALGPSYSQDKLLLLRGQAVAASEAELLLLLLPEPQHLAPVVVRLTGTVRAVVQY